MNVCIHNAGGVLLYDYSCEDEQCDSGAGCGSNGRGQMRPSLLVLDLGATNVHTHTNYPAFVSNNRHTFLYLVGLQKNNSTIRLATD